MQTMSDTPLPSGKFSRALKTTAMATRTGAKHLGYLGAKRFSNDKEALRTKHEEEIGKILFQGLSQMRGTALKASQLLSMESELLPAGIRKQLSQGCYKVPPINKALVRKVFMQEFQQSPQQLFSQFESDAFAAASLGQVHKALSKDGKNIAVKVQYPGVRESIDSDLKILVFILSSMQRFSDMMPKQSVIDTTLDEISCCLRDEVSYIKEAENTQWFAEQLQTMGIRIPRVIEEHSSERILCTELIEGLHVEEWLWESPSQEEINIAGQTIFNLFLHCAFKLRALHADPHEGNFLFLPHGQVALLDFGCIKKLNPDFCDAIASTISSFVAGDQELILKAYQSIGLVNKNLSFEEYREKVMPVLAPMQEWLALPFRSEQFDFSTLPSPPVSHSSKNNEAIRYLNEIQRDQLYFDRTLFGIFQLLKKMGAKIRTQNIWIA